MLLTLKKIVRETWSLWVFFIVVGFMTSREMGFGFGGTFMMNFTFAVLSAFWVVSDARRRQRQMGYGFPALVFFLWPIFVPVYLFQTRGTKAFLSLLGFAAILILGQLIGVSLGLLTR